MKTPKPPVSDAVRQYLRELGRKGGSATGKTKLRGTREYYREIALKRWRDKGNR